MDVASWFASGRAVDIALVALLVEGIALCVFRARTGRGPGPRAVLANLAAGACLLLALRAALTGASWQTVAVWLLAALAANLADLAERLRRPR